MRARPVLATLSVVGFLVGALPVLAKDEAPLPQPPPTPLPAFENPLHDAKVGETLRFRVTEPSGSGPVRWYEERVLARKPNDRVLLETVETNETGEKIFSVDPQRSGWRPAPATFKLPDDQSWVPGRQKDEIVYLGTPPKHAVRATRRVLDEPLVMSDPKGRRRERKIWYSHDVPCSGKVKEFPFPGVEDAERTAVSWDRTMTAEECAERAKRYRDPEDQKKEEEKKEEPKEGGDAPPAMGGGSEAPPGMDGGTDAPPGMGG